MMYPLIRCNNSATSINPIVFYILCKGDSAGKPGLKPWTNSFAVICPNEKYFDFYFWLVYGLFRAGKFKCRHRGTAIQFINLKDIQNLVREVAPDIYLHWEKYQQIIAALAKLEKRKVSFAQRILDTEKMQQYLIRSHFIK